MISNDACESASLSRLRLPQPLRKISIFAWTRPPCSHAPGPPEFAKAGLQVSGEARAIAERRLRDPLERVRSFLHKQQLVDDAFFTELDEEAEVMAKRLRDGVRNLPDPQPADMFAHAYAEPNSLLTRQHAELDAYLAGFVPEEAR